MMGRLRWMQEYKTPLYNNDSAFIQQRTTTMTTTTTEAADGRNIIPSPSHTTMNNQTTDTRTQSCTRRVWVVFLKEDAFGGQGLTILPKAPSLLLLHLYLPGASRWMNWKISMADCLQAELQQCLFTPFTTTILLLLFILLAFYLFMPFCLSNSI
ncbi:MAG: hypothetical protein JOS17DRAFT_379680 [Linnemannia elongata]|nr:MAG: hypothetical protein JOS17DRAFT_379680 [Linnemannia elongata]